MIKTLNLAGRRFPLVGIVCPRAEGDADPDWHRSLGVDDPQWHVPAENGVLFAVEAIQRGGDVVYDLAMYSAACCLVIDHDDEYWLPTPVYLHNGDLHAQPWGSLADGRILLHPGVHEWRGADADWVAETIDRLGRKPFTVDEDAPRVRLVAADAELEGRPTCDGSAYARRATST